MTVKELVVKTTLMVVVLAAGTFSVRAQSDRPQSDKVDTDHNRVLIWNSLPSSDQPPALVIFGQNNSGNGPNAQELRNKRVLIFNQLPCK